MARSATTWQRARRPEQKEVRRQAILEAAGRLLDAEGLEGTGLNAIARASGVSKANIYRYFESREAVLLHLLLEESAAWLDALIAQLRRQRRENDIDGVARVLASTLTPRTRLCLLLTTLAGVLEHNVSEDLVLDFKRRLNALLSGPHQALAEALPALSMEQVREFFMLQMLMVSGGWPHCHPSPVVARVLAQPEFAAMRLDFEQTVRSNAATLLRGMMSQGEVA